MKPIVAFNLKKKKSRRGCAGGEAVDNCRRSSVHQLRVPSGGVPSDSSSLAQKQYVETEIVNVIGFLLN
jgi:hypothetical protein